MSGICGVVALDGQPDVKDELIPIMNAMQAYGSDGHGICNKKSAALGHQMLHNTPESLNENLPRSDNEARLTITASARIDNREELFGAMGVPIGERANVPDSQLILRSYQKWGKDCPEKLLGDFAFAIWDENDKTLFCARDIMGIKPFYYFAGKKRFVFASDIVALLEGSEVPNELNIEYIANMFRYRGIYAHNKLSHWNDIFKLPPANAAIVKTSGMRKWTYWKAGCRDDIRLKSDEEYGDMLVEVFQKAVKCRLRSAFPIGTHLSGGLDTSVIAAMAARHLRRTGKSLTGFSWSPPPKPDEYPLTDERARVEAVAKQEGIAVHYTPVSVTDAAAFSLRRADHNKAGYIMEYVVRKTVADLGIRTIFSGWGGDKLTRFNWVGYLDELFLKRNWVKLARAIPRHAKWRRQKLREFLPKFLLGKIVLPSLPDRLYFKYQEHAAERNPRPRDRYPRIPPIFSSDFAESLEAEEIITAEPLERKDMRQRMQEALLKGNITKRIESWAAEGASHSIDYCYPLLDRRVLDAIPQLPPLLFFKTGWIGYLPPKTIAELFPADVAWAERKIDQSIRDHHARTRKSWEDPVLYPYLRKFVDDGGKFTLIDNDKMANFLRNGPYDDGGETFGQHGIVAALRIELMQNPQMVTEYKIRKATAGIK